MIVREIWHIILCLGHHKVPHFSSCLDLLLIIPLNFILETTLYLPGLKEQILVPFSDVISDSNQYIDRS